MKRKVIWIVLTLAAVAGIAQHGPDLFPMGHISLIRMVRPAPTARQAALTLPDPFSKA
jgi:hypothetical protein